MRRQKLGLLKERWELYHMCVDWKFEARHAEHQNAGGSFRTYSFKPVRRIEEEREVGSSSLCVRSTGSHRGVAHTIARVLSGF